MLRSRIFWVGLMAGTIGLYIFLLGLIFFSQAGGIAAALLASLLLLHLAELNTALGIGRARGLKDSRIILMTFLFGFTWWLPVKWKILP